MVQIKNLISKEFNKLDKFKQNTILRIISLSKTHYYQFINGDKVGKLNKEKSISVNTFFSLCNELGISLSATKNDNQCQETK